MRTFATISGESFIDREGIKNWGLVLQKLNLPKDFNGWISTKFDGNNQGFWDLIENSLTQARLDERSQKFHFSLNWEKGAVRLTKTIENVSSREEAERILKHQAFF